MSVVKIAPGSGGAAPTGVIGMVNNAVAETATIDTRPNSHFRPLDCVFMFILSLSPKEVLVTSTGCEQSRRTFAEYWPEAQRIAEHLHGQAWRSWRTASVHFGPDRRLCFQRDCKIVRRKGRVCGEY